MIGGAKRSPAVHALRPKVIAMPRPLLMFSVALLAAPFAPSAAAQTSNDRVLMIYGNDKCPAGTICIRGSESERYRIPKSIRDTTPSVTPGTNSQRALAASTASVSSSGIGSCGATGPGGYIGCWKQEMQAARAQKQADREAAAVPER